MADTKITEMVAGSMSASDLLTFVSDPSGTPANKKIALSAFETGLTVTESQISDLGAYATVSYVDSAIAGLTALESEDIDTLAEINAIISDATLISSTATDASGYGWVIDEDDMLSDSATKVPTQQSVKAYVDAEVAGAGGASDHGALSGLGDDDHTQYLLADGSRAGTGIQELLGLSLTDSTELTIAAGAVTATQGYHTIDTESDAATDDLDTVTVAGGEGDVLVLRAESSARTVVIKHGTGNIQCSEGYDLSLDSDYDYAILIRKDATNWMAVSGARRMPPYLDIGDTLGGALSGDIYYHDGSTVTNLRKGTDGEVLTLASGLPSWVAAAGGGSGGSLTVTKKTANYTAAAGDLVVCDATTGAFTVTMPLSPSADDVVGVYLEHGNFTLSVTIQGNGKTLAEFGASMTLYGPGELVTFQYDGAKWVVVAQNGGPLVDSKDHFFGAADPTKTVRIDCTDVATTRTVTLSPQADAAGSDLTFDLRKNQAGGGVPAPSNDDSEGYTIGSQWFSSTTPVGLHICRNATSGIWDLVGVKRNTAATVAPTADDDAGDGYAVSSIWVDTTADQAYVCLDESSAAAVWVQIAKTPGITTLTDGTPITVDASLQPKQQITLVGNRTLAFSNFQTGQTISLKLTQDGTGSRTVTWPSSGVTINWAGGSAPTLTTTANKSDWIVLVCTDDTTSAEVYDAAVAMANV